MKRVFKIAVATVMMVLCMSMISFAQEKIEVTDETQLLNAFDSGGYAVLEDNITTDDIDSIYVGHDILIDLNGNNLIINGGDYTFDANVCFMNGRANLFGENLTVHADTLAMKNGLLNVSQLTLRIGSRAELLAVGEDAYVVVAPKYYTSPITTLSVDSELISGEMLMSIAKTGELPELQKDGYSFDGWKALPGNVVTNWKETTHADLIRATWSEKTASIFGGGRIWVVLTIIFFISAVALAMLYVRKK